MRPLHAISININTVQLFDHSDRERFNPCWRHLQRNSNDPTNSQVLTRCAHALLHSLSNGPIFVERERQKIVGIKGADIDGGDSTFSRHRSSLRMLQISCEIPSRAIFAKLKRSILDSKPSRTIRIITRAVDPCSSLILVATENSDTFTKFTGSGTMFGMELDTHLHNSNIDLKLRQGSRSRPSRIQRNWRRKRRKHKTRPTRS